ncbi:hypothetical protein DCAR_0417223 [Daucus carota subsp. sativus]|uniref:Uncharacterized protein n=1 Tax=Daucus carota subsp. sativus TaxID=79200 RepID=A0A165Y7U5_DAUCS|nr:hypothetical protein DCAR_0417223 [Daucus carota subsp. sativus]
MCCCGCKICTLCLCLIAVVITIGVLFGFGVFKKAYHSIHNDLHYSYSATGRRGGPALFAPSPF